MNLARLANDVAALVATTMAANTVGVRVGIDHVDLPAFARSLRLGGSQFLSTIYCPTELDWAAGRVERLGARFAAKEASAKALGTGMRGVSWTDFEVRSTPTGQPTLVLHGRASASADELGVCSWALSLSHTATTALAIVVALTDRANP